MDLGRLVSSAVPGLRVSDTTVDRLSYSRDLWPRRLIETRAGRVHSEPGCIVWPRTAEAVVRLVEVARAEGISLVPFGAGSGVCGAVHPDARTVVVDMKEMAGFDVEAEGSILDVGPGAMGVTLEEDLARRGLTIGHFPSSILCSTVGGWIAARGAGQCSGLYGKIEDMVVSVECVLGNGELVTLRRRCDGPSALPLMIGSEGTLGIITRARLRLHPAPAQRTYAAFSFSDIVGGWEAMRALFQEGLRPAVARLYDPIDSALMREGTVKAKGGPGATKKSGGTTARLIKLLPTLLKAPRLLNAAIEAAEGNLLGGATLVLVFEGSSDEVHADRDRADAVCRRQGGRVLGEGPARRWFGHRYSVSYRQSPLFRSGAFSDTMEVAAPWSRLAELYDAVRGALGKHVLVMAHLSHAYPDGCSIYFTFSGMGRDHDDALAKYDCAWREALDAAVAAGGTISHHHGVGRSKAPKLGREMGFGVEVVRRVMRAWDPDGILNPGALAPREDEPGTASVTGAAPTEPSIDTHSLTARLPGDMPLGVAEELLTRHGLSLSLADDTERGQRVSRWVASGAATTHDPWADPVRQTVSGLQARLPSQERFEIRPAPRRAVGPDLVALYLGADERAGVVEAVTVSLEREGSPRARPLPFAGERNPHQDDGERAAFAALVDGVTNPGKR